MSGDRHPAKRYVSADNYRDLSAPFPSEDAGKKAVDAFLIELTALRLKHRISDVYVIARVTAETPQGHDAVVQTKLHLGSDLHSEAMTAWAFGQERAQRQERIQAMIERGSKVGK